MLDRFAGLACEGTGTAAAKAQLLLTRMLACKLTLAHSGVKWVVNSKLLITLVSEANKK